MDFLKYNGYVLYTDIEKVFTMFEQDFHLMRPNEFRDILLKEPKDNLAPGVEYGDILAAYNFYYYTKLNQYTDPNIFQHTGSRVWYTFRDNKMRRDLHTFIYDIYNEQVIIKREDPYHIY